MRVPFPPWRTSTGNTQQQQVEQRCISQRCQFNFTRRQWISYLWSSVKNYFTCLRLGAKLNWDSRTSISEFWTTSFCGFCAFVPEEMTQYQFYRVCDCDQLNYGKSPNYDRNSIRMALIRKMPFISSFYYLDFFEQHWKAQTDRYKVQTSTRDRWMYFTCHSLNMFKGLYFFN